MAAPRTRTARQQPVDIIPGPRLADSTPSLGGSGRYDRGDRCCVALDPAPLGTSVCCCPVSTLFTAKRQPVVRLRERSISCRRQRHYTLLTGNSQSLALLRLHFRERLLDLHDGNFIPQPRPAAEQIGIFLGGAARIFGFPVAQQDVMRF